MSNVCSEVDWLFVVENCPSAVIIADEKAQIGFFNRAAEEMFRTSSQESVGQRLDTLITDPGSSKPVGSAGSHRVGLLAVLGTTRRLVAHRSNGQTFPVELLVTKLDRSKSPLHYAVFLRDASEQEAMQRQLLENERLAAIGMSTSILAHEIGNPLNGMYLQGQLLERNLQKDSHPALSRASAMLSEIQRLTSLLEEFSRGKTLPLERINLRELLEDVAHVQRAGFSLASVSLILDISETPGLIRGQRDKLKQVFLNLFKNAAEAMPDGGRVDVRVRPHLEWLHVLVEDTGPGLPRGIDIYQPFTTTKARGTGLGLSIVQQIIQAHGGRIRHEPRPGGGTRFIVALPLVDGHSTVDD